MHRLQPLLTVLGVAAVALGAGLALGQRAAPPSSLERAAAAAEPRQPAAAAAIEDPALSTRDPAPRGTVIEPIEHPPATSTAPVHDNTRATSDVPDRPPELARPAAAPVVEDSATTAPAPAFQAPASGSSSVERYVVQVASMQDAKEAQLRAKQVESLGLPCFVERADLGAQGVWYRVLSGAYANEAAARTALATLQGGGRFVGCYVRAY